MENFEQGGNAYAKLKIGTAIKPIGELTSPEKGVTNSEYIAAKIKELREFYQHLNKNRISLKEKMLMPLINLYHNILVTFNAVL